jgi:hypothetical protein
VRLGVASWRGRDGGGDGGGGGGVGMHTRLGMIRRQIDIFYALTTLHFYLAR